MIFLSTAVVCFVALGFAFSNGFRDSSTIVATAVSTRALSATKAFRYCALFEFLGAMFIGSAVMATVGKIFFVQQTEASQTQLLLVLFCGLLASILWGVICWWQAWPASNKQALFAGLAGAGFAAWGSDVLNKGSLLVVLIVLVVSPLIGFLFSVILTFIIRRLGERLTPQVKPVVQKLQVMALMMVSCAHGSNDGQMVMGVIVLAIGLLNVLSPLGAESIEVFSYAVRFAIALSLAFGVLLGGKRILKKLGMQFYHIKPTQGLGAQLTSVLTILSCNFSGFPASTTQVITGSIVGAGVAKNAKAIRWQVAQGIAFSWLMTLPFVGFLGFVLCTVGLFLMRGS